MLRNVWSKMDMVHLTQVASDLWNKSWMKEYEFRLLIVGCASNFPKNILIDESTGEAIISWPYKVHCYWVFHYVTWLLYFVSPKGKKKIATRLSVLFCHFLGELNRIPQHTSCWVCAIMIIELGATTNVPWYKNWAKVFQQQWDCD